MNAAQWLVRALEAEGVDTLFGYPGGAIMPFYDALVDSSLKHILVRHEQGAALAASAGRFAGAPQLLLALAGCILVAAAGLAVAVLPVPWKLSLKAAAAALGARVGSAQAQQAAQQGVFVQS